MEEQVKSLLKTLFENERKRNQENIKENSNKLEFIPIYRGEFDKVAPEMKDEER